MKQTAAWPHQPRAAWQSVVAGLDRAGKRNAFDSAMIADLAQALGNTRPTTSCAARCCLPMASTSPPGWI